jgi:hypothetical protein
MGLTWQLTLYFNSDLPSTIHGRCGQRTQCTDYTRHPTYHDDILHCNRFLSSPEYSHGLQGPTTYSRATTCFLQAWNCCGVLWLKMSVPLPPLIHMPSWCRKTLWTINKESKTHNLCLISCHYASKVHGTSAPVGQWWLQCTQAIPLPSATTYVLDIGARSIIEQRLRPQDWGANRRQEMQMRTAAIQTRFKNIRQDSRTKAP